MPDPELNVTEQAAPPEPRRLVPKGFRPCATKQPRESVPVIVITDTRAVVIATYGLVTVPGMPFLVAKGFSIAGGQPVNAVCWRPIPRNWL